MNNLSRFYVLHKGEICPMFFMGGGWGVITGSLAMDFSPIVVAKFL
jgi:hypothetical protein